MKNIVLLLAVVFSSTSISLGEPLAFKNFNFSLELPIIWQISNPPPAGTIGVLISPDNSKEVIIIASKFPEDKVDGALEEMVKGAKIPLSEKGIEIQNERDLLINGVPFHVFSFKAPNGNSIVTYMGQASNIGYSIQGLSMTTNADSDVDLTGIIRSFRLLNAVEPSHHPDQLLNTVDPSRNPDLFEMGGSEFGKIVGNAAIITFILAAAWILLKAKKKKD